MLKRIVSITVSILMLWSSAYAASVPVLEVEYVFDEEQTYTYAATAVNSVTEYAMTDDCVFANAKHELVEDLPTWDGSVVTPQQDSDGTYLISTAAELAGFAALVNTQVNGSYPNLGINARLTRDINMQKSNGENNYWNQHCIGLFASSVTQIINPYKGTFDGQGHTIYNFAWIGGAANDKTSRVRSYHIGLFAYIGEGAVLKNFNMVDVDVCMASWLGTNSAASVVCGLMAGTADNPALIENVYVSGKAYSVSNTLYGVTYAYGSVAGIIQNGAVRSCHSDVEVNLTTDSENALSNLRKGHTTITASSGTAYGIGGVVGMTWHTSPAAEITGCGNGGNIMAPDYICVGGVIGTLTRTGGDSFSVADCYNTGDVTGYRDVGGVIGLIASDAVHNMNMYNTGNITAVAQTETYASGLANHGAAAAGINGYSTGIVQIKSAKTADGKYAYSATAAPMYNDTIGLLFSDEDSNAATDANVLYPTDDSYEADGEPMWAISYGGSPRVTASVGTGMNVEEMKGEEALSLLGSGFVADIGINDGLPVLKSQYDYLVPGNNTYELAKYDTTEKALGVELKEPGYVALSANLITDSAVIAAYDSQGNILDRKTVTSDGVVNLSTQGETAVTVSFEGEGRALVKVLESEEPVASLSQAIIRASVGNISEESITVVAALYNNDNTLTAVEYIADVPVTDGIASAVINLNNTAIGDCKLKVYAWKNGTLVPVGAAAEPLI